MHQIRETSHTNTPDGLNVVYIDNQNSLDLHTHGRFKELVVVFSGQCQHVTTTGNYPLKKGDVFIIPEGTPHGYAETENVRLVNILYVPDQLQLPGLDIACIPGYHALNTYNPQETGIRHFGGALGVGFKALKTIDYLAGMIEKELAGRSPGYCFAAAGYLMQILCVLARSCLEKVQPAQEGLAGLAQVLSFMEAEFAQKITVGQLAKMACMSESSFNRLFRRVMNCSPMDYLLRLRLEKAEKHLLNTNATVAQVSYASGFHDISHFSRFFKRINDCSPSEFRRRQIAQQDHS